MCCNFVHEGQMLLEDKLIYLAHKVQNSLVEVGVFVTFTNHEDFLLTWVFL